MDDSKAGYQATPSATLEQQIMDACAPKNEREWWASAEITRLRAEVEALRADAERYRWLRDGSNPPWVMQMLERYADNGSDFDAEVDAARAPQQAEPVAKIIRNDSGQVRMVDGSGEPFDMFAHVGQSYYAHPPAAEVQRLREALKPFAAIDLTTNQAVDAMDVLRARRALEGK